jgi:hypothetical protein
LQVPSTSSCPPGKQFLKCCDTAHWISSTVWKFRPFKEKGRESS